ncbi:efflux RND transporter periplasmic adaptor subunit [Candidatus Babeliales bacterium]|nr:efflux RND transporter periplasmic adaptor subunit [Candidatus Babeliales bacterium]
MNYKKISVFIGTVFIFIVVIVIFYFYFKFNQKQKNINKEQHVKTTQMTNKIPEYSDVHIPSYREQLMGIITEKIKIRNLKKMIRTVGIVEVDERLKSVIQTKFSGWIEDLFVNFTGIPVKKGQPLFTVYSPELYSTQEEYILALQDNKFGKGYLAEHFKRLNNDLVNATKRRLELWDIPDGEIAKLEKIKKPSKRLVLRSPSDGIVLGKNAFIGMNVGPGMVIFTVADLSHVWIIADIYEQDIELVKMGQKGKIKATSLPDKTIEGKITFIQYTVDNPTRTAKIRFECDNKNFALKPGMYSTVNIEVPIGNGLALPEEALIDTGKRKIVFVSLGNGHYEPRQVRLGYKADAFYQVLGGLEVGDSVVTSAQFLLDSESRIKSSSGGGMKEHGM